MMKRVPCKNGFTLIELVLVTAILVVVGMALYGTFASGINIWKRVSQRPVTEDVGLFFQNISFDLRNSFRIEGIKFRGGERRISFPARIKRRNNGKPEDSIGQVTYSFGRRKGEVYKEQADYSEVYRKKPGYKKVLVEGIRSLRFKYFIYDSESKKYSWVTNWQERDEPFGAEVEDHLPLIVRVEIGVQKEKFEQKFVKTISMPAACCWPLVDE